MTHHTSSAAVKYRWNDMTIERVNDQLGRRLVSGERVMLAQVHLEAGCAIPRHAHVHEQITYVLEGALQLSFGENAEQEHTFRAGEVVVIPSNLPHQGKALEKTLVMDVFSPPREDWINKTDTYLRR